MFAIVKLIDKINNYLKLEFIIYFKSNHIAAKEFFIYYSESCLKFEILSNTIDNSHSVIFTYLNIC